MIIALLLAAADPCALPAPAAEPDPAAAQAYVEVAESETVPGAALEAFRQALRLDPSNARARSGFQAVCQPHDDAFEQARAKMDAGDRAGAIALFEQLRPLPAAALLEGICLYELHQDDAAETLLLDAQADDDTADSARFFLALIARRRGEEAEAERLFGQVAQGASGIAGQARQMLRETRERLSLSLLAESGYDSNVSLSPSNAPLGGDALASIAGALVWRPSPGFFLRATGFYRAQPSLSDYDLGALGAAAGYAYGPVSAEYDYDFVALGNAPYLSAHRLAAEGRLPLGAVTLSLSYALRFENYRTATTDPFSGTDHRLQLSALWHVSGPAWVELAYRVDRDLATYPETTYIEHGPVAGLRLVLGRFRASAEASAGFRNYDALDPSLGVQQNDTLLDASVQGEYEVDRRWSVRLSLGARDQLSNVAELEYVRGYAIVGLAFASGL